MDTGAEHPATYDFIQKFDKSEILVYRFVINLGRRKLSRVGIKNSEIYGVNVFETEQWGCSDTE